ncbi:ABC transporter permease [Kordiimonas marina]|uniref:ABC transporter permease n=1 Tax=Kordiimonas marina TaxID=2872312 RepID=UPI001FF3A566|nr:ABC transporter permease [Kordiimonas marina]MCJ9429423.1 ABC transporter permease [Kordiimonas marina]
MKRPFSITRLSAMLLKEFNHMRRDRTTMGMMVVIPLMQLILFGFAINTDPKALPTAIYSADTSEYTRDFTAALVNTGYFHIVKETRSQEHLDEMLTRGQVQFAIFIPENFTRRLIKGERPQILVEADATDPVATGSAISALNAIKPRVMTRDLKGITMANPPAPPAFDVVVHRRYNPENITQYNIVPGLMGVVLTMTLVMITGLAVTRERERGTMENLLAMPVRPMEVMLGKILPYVLVGYIQATIILMAAAFLFRVPVEGSLTMLSGATILFMIANLGVGFTFSTVAQNQLQAVQMTFFFFLPSVLLSGFMFPFRGMPVWAQAIGEILPLTHFLRIARGILLKGSHFADIQADLLALVAFVIVSTGIAMARYRQTLD